MKKKVFILGLFSMVLMGTAQSQVVEINGEIRPRFEFRDGFQKPLADTLSPALTTLQRSRLSAGYKSKLLNTQLTLQDSRIFGSNDTKSSTSKIEIYEAWAEVLLTPGISAEIGRQKLKYDDQRILATADWSNTGLAHDVALFKYKQQSIQAHLGLAYNNTKDTMFEVNYTVSKMYKTMAFLWLSKEFENGLSLSAIGLRDGFQSSNNYKKTFYRNTIGGNIVYTNDSSKLAFNIAAYYQFGKSNAYDTAKFVKNITYANLGAYLLAYKVKYKIISKLSAQVGLDYYSGTGSTTSNKESYTFNRLYGATHSFNGSMEYFKTVPKAGLADYYGGLTSNISSNLSIDITGHLFNLVKDMKYTVKDKAGKKTTVNVGKNIGSEIDAVLNYKLTKETSIQAGYSIYINSKSTKDYFKMGSTSIDTPQWAYLMLTIKPNFFKTPEVKLN